MKLAPLFLIALAYHTVTAGALLAAEPVIVSKPVIVIEHVPMVDENPDLDVMIPEQAAEEPVLEADPVFIEHIVEEKLAEPEPPAEEVAAFLMVPSEVANNIQLVEHEPLEIVGSAP